MKKLSVVTTLDTTVAGFWKLFLSKEFNQKLYIEGLGFKSYEILEMSETHRRTKGVPKMKLPGPVAKLLGDSFGYEENGTLDLTTNVFRWKMTPNTLTDKLFTSGVVTLEALGDNKVRRTSEATIEAKVFGVGGLLEGTAEAEIRTSWGKEADFMNRWIREHAA